MGEKKDNGDKKPKKTKGTFRNVSYFLSTGLAMAASILIGALIGGYLDGLLGTSPWLLFVFSLLGVGAAIGSVYNMTKDK